MPCWTIWPERPGQSRFNALRLAAHAVWVLALTVVTQVGGVAWLIAVLFRWRWCVFGLAYGALWVAAMLVAPMTGRQALPCFGDTLRMQSAFYCATLRHFVTPELAQVAQDAAEVVAREFPGTVTLALDGGHPFGQGWPLLPHLSHNDGRKLDFAFYYRDAQGAYLPGKARAPLGYFAFETLDVQNCPAVWPSLRWNLAWAQGLWPDRPLDAPRTRALIAALVADGRVGKVFVEPPLLDRLGMADPKLRFQGCRAARHDDHIHAQL